MILTRSHHVYQTGRKVEAAEGCRICRWCHSGDLTISQAPKKDKKEETEEEKAFKDKKKADAEALKAARDKGRQLRNCESTRLTYAALKGGPLVGGGIKK